MTVITRLVLVGALLGSMADTASADTITASGQGWCKGDGMCNSTTASTINNTFAGSLSGFEYRDWFAFRLPLGDITAGTLNIWNDEANFTDVAAATFEVRDASEISFGGLLGATMLGSISVQLADAGVSSHFVSIPLNPDAIRLLNAADGSLFVLGGVVTPFVPTSPVQIFGYTSGPPAAFLELSGDLSSPVPEPASYLLVAMGLAVLVLTRRKGAHAGTPLIEAMS